MQLRLNEAGGLIIDEPFDFRSFSLRLQDGQSAAPEILTLDGDVAWVEEDALRNLEGLADRPAWQAGLTGMIEFARARGWVDPVTGRIRAHIERAGT